MKIFMDIRKRLTRFVTESSGATLVEYGVALLVVILVGAAAVTGLATEVTNELNETASAF